MVQSFLFKVFYLAILVNLISGQLKGQERSTFLLDMVHNNPGEKLTETSFNDPVYLKGNGYNGIVFNDFVFPQAAITFDRLNPAIFPKNSASRKWVVHAANRINEHIKKAHQAGLKAYYLTDIVVLPKKLVEIYHDEICDKNGLISFERPKTLEIHRLMIDELFKTFPGLDGLVIRTGETYLNNVPYHTGNNPITNGAQSHIKILNLLRDEVCVKRGKKIIYRTWSIGGFHNSAQYYLSVANHVQTHSNLVFSIKHTQGDYQRTFGFNPTLGLGKHKQIVEVQCQREYEGKGAYPNYIMNGLINGFEEYSNPGSHHFKGLKDLTGLPNFAGVWTWSRGGGWVGPYITNEFWCKLNAFVAIQWAQNMHQSESQIFDDFMDKNGLAGVSRQNFRDLCLLSASAVLRGHASALPYYKSNWVWWMRDEFLGGTDRNADSAKFDSEGYLYDEFSTLYKGHQLQKAVDEKYEAVKLWNRIVYLSQRIVMPNKKDQEYIRVSSQYGLLLYKIIASGWKVMALGFQGDQTGDYNKPLLKQTLSAYDECWQAYRELKIRNPSCATLYKPYAFVFKGPSYHGKLGMGASIDVYREMLK